MFVSKESAISRIDAVMAFWGKTDVCIAVEDMPINGAVDRYFNCNTFIDERALFTVDCPSAYDSALGSGCDFEFSVLPFPKYTEAQKNYLTTPNSYGSVIGIPSTADEETVGFFVQALAEESTETTLKTFIETKCKLQDAYDERCAKMLDIVFEGVVYDIVLVCDFGKMQTFVSEEMGKSRKNYYSRYYDRYASKAQYEMEQLLDKYEGL